MNKPKAGRLEIIIGNMFSGKSTELIRRINRERSINKRITVINYSLDNRYSSDGISTHDMISFNSLKLNNLMDFPFKEIDSVDSFFIDEAQFFSDLYVFVQLLVDIYSKNVIISGLSGDVKRCEFGQILKLIPLADTVDKLNAYCTVCNDRNEAPFTKRIKSEDTDSQIEIGGSDKYISVCRYHFINN